MSNFIELDKINFAVWSILFGDSERDISAAQAAGLRDGIFFNGGNLSDAVKAELEKLS